MDTTTEIKKIRKQLPTGAIKEIAKRTGLSTTLISLTMQGKSRPQKLPEILRATAEFLSEYKARELEAMQAIQEILNPLE